MDVTALIASLIMMSYVGRKPLLTIGHSLMALLTMLIGLLFYFNRMMGVLITTISYLFVFLSMTGPASFGITTEICTDIALGIAMSQIITSIGLFYFLNKNMVASLQGNYTVIYLIFSIYCLMALFFTCRNVKETKNLTDKEKKLLYAPETKVTEVQTDIQLGSIDLPTWP